MTILWGGTWYAIKLGYSGTPPLVGAGLRFGLAGGVLLALSSMLRSRWPNGPRQWGLAGFVGVIMFGADYGLLYWGGQHIPTSLASVLFATLPLWTLAAGIVARVERLTAAKVAGALLGLVGVAVLSWNSAADVPSAAAGIAAILAAAACAAVATVAMKRHAAGIDLVPFNAVAMLVGSVVLLAAAVARGEAVALPTTAAAWGSLLYLSIGASAIAFVLYARIVRDWDASRAAYVTLLTPVATLALGALALDEPIGIHALGGSALVLAGAYATTRPPGWWTRAARSRPECGGRPCAQP